MKFSPPKWLIISNFAAGKVACPSKLEVEKGKERTLAGVNSCIIAELSLLKDVPHFRDRYDESEALRRLELG